MCFGGLFSTLPQSIRVRLISAVSRFRPGKQNVSDRGTSAAIQDTSSCESDQDKVPQSYMYGECDFTRSIC